MDALARVFLLLAGVAAAGACAMAVQAGAWPLATLAFGASALGFCAAAR